MMKASLGTLRRFALNKIDAKGKGEFLYSSQFDELGQAAKEMQDMRDCYDRLLAAAAATANSAYEFSESLGEMGSCLEKIAPHNDEDSGSLLLMLGKVQFELQMLVDNYRSHIFKTITNPSESLLNELRTVEDMKQQCDEKRNVYEYVMEKMKEKGRPKGGKEESLNSQQLQTVHKEFNEEATLCIFRLKSLKQGQSHSLLTQAARHHAAQMYLFRSGLKSLEAVEQHVRAVAQKQHIDFQISAHGNESEDCKDDGTDDQDTTIDGELSFDHRVNTQRVVVLSMLRNSMMIDLDKKEDERASSSDHRASSHSAPLSTERRTDPTESLRLPQPSATQNSCTYVLPAPTDSKNSCLMKPVGSSFKTRPENHTGHTHHIWHSSPLEQMKPMKDSDDSNFSSRLPLPFADGLKVPQSDASDASNMQNVKGRGFSGLLPSKPASTRPFPSDTSPGMLSRPPVPQPSSPRVSQCASPPLASSPRVSELHELPRPPDKLVLPKRVKTPGLFGHLAPLTARNQDVTVADGGLCSSTSVASPLPTPPLVVPRSISTPSRDQRTMALHVSRLLESPRVPEKSEETASPPLTPLSLTDHKSATLVVPQMAAQTDQIRV